MNTLQPNCVPVDVGRLADEGLELVAPEERWVESLMAALRHPTTRRDMPRIAGTTRQQVADFLSHAGGGFDPGEWAADLVPAYHFWMRQIDVEAGEPPIVGGINLRIGQGPNIERVIGHIGYHVYPFARGHHFAERACRLLLPLAQRHGIKPVWITCNPENTASRRTCERLGARLTEIVPVPPDHPLHARGETVKCLYRIDL